MKSFSTFFRESVQSKDIPALDGKPELYMLRADIYGNFIDACRVRSESHYHDFIDYKQRGVNMTQYDSCDELFAEAESNLSNILELNYLKNITFQSSMQKTPEQVQQMCKENAQKLKAAVDMFRGVAGTWWIYSRKVYCIVPLYYFEVDLEKCRYSAMDDAINNVVDDQDNITNW